MLFRHFSGVDAALQRRTGGIAMLLGDVARHHADRGSQDSGIVGKAEQWLKSHNVEAATRAKFDEFLKQSPATGANAKTDADRETLFKQFQAWEAERGARAQVPHPPQR